MPYHKTPIRYPGGKVREDTAKINENFTELAKSFVNEDPTTYKVINADKVDDYHASQTPSANTIPVADNTGKLHLNWIPQGSGSGLNADQVDGFHASQTPASNTIPVAGADGKLDVGWLPSISFSSLFQTASFSLNPISFSLNTIYQANKNMLCLFCYQDFVIKIGPTSPPSIQLTMEHYYSTIEAGFGIFIIPKNWYWMVISATNTTWSEATNGFWEIVIT